MPLPHVRESKALLDYRFHGMDSGFHVLYMFMLVEPVFWIPIVSRILQDSTRKVFPDSEFYRQKSGRQKSGFLYMGDDTFYSKSIQQKSLLGR